MTSTIKRVLCVALLSATANGLCTTQADCGGVEICDVSSARRGLRFGNTQYGCCRRAR